MAYRLLVLISMDKQTEKQIVAEVVKILGRNYRNADLDSDDIDNAAFAVAELFGIDEDGVRYIADLPRL